MKTLTRVVRQQFLGPIALLIVVGGVATAATGQNFKLGLLNTEDKKSILRNTGNGPALDLQVKAGQAPLTVSSNKVVPKLNASLLQGKVASAFAAAGSSYTKAESDGKYALDAAAYTKAQSDAKYALTGAGYTKTQSDAKYALTGAAYTKAESDANYAAAGSSYTKAQSDERYGQILFSGTFSGSTGGTGADTTIFTQSVNLPSAGMVKVLIFVTTPSGTTPIFVPKIDGVGGSGGTSFVENGNGRASSGAVEVTVHVSDSGGDSVVGGAGNILVVFFPV